MIDPMETHWETIQAKTFTKWINDKLSKGGYAPITNIYKDFRDGVSLGNLLNVLLNSNIYYNKKPFTRIQKVENLKILLKHVKDCGLSLINIGPEDIVDGNKKLILGLVWTLISKLAISDLGFDSSVRNELLRWCRDVTKSYKNVNITDLSRSWQDGLGFNAIIHYFRPDLLNYNELKPNDSHRNLQQAFEIAEDKLQIPKLLDVEDVADVVRPDEKIMITYLTEYYKKFSSFQKERICKNVIENFLAKIELSIQGRNFYEIMARSFLNKQKLFNDKKTRLCKLLDEVKDLVDDMETMNNDMLQNYMNVYSTYSEIREINKMYNIKEYLPPKDIAISSIIYDYVNTMDIVKEGLGIEKTKQEHKKDVYSHVTDINKEVSAFTCMCTNESTKSKLAGLQNCQKQLIETKGDVRSTQGLDIIKAIVKKHYDFLHSIISEYVNKESIIKKAEVLYKKYCQGDCIMIKNFPDLCTELGLYIDDEIMSQIQSHDGLLTKDQVIDSVRVLCTNEYDSVMIKRVFNCLGGDVYDVNESDYMNLVNYTGKNGKLRVYKLVDEFMKQ